MKPDDWADFINREYLDVFVRQGGAAIKFAVPMDDISGVQAVSAITTVASDAGYLVARVSAADTRIHMMDQVFFRIADQIDWQGLCERVILRLAKEDGYRVPAQGPGSLLARIADENQIESTFLMGEMRRVVQRVFRYRKMSKDFRVAMSQLCLAQLTGGGEGDTAIATLTNWITGRNLAVSAVKPYQIFTRINRTNARHAFESLLRWIQFAGYAGIVVILDIARLTIARNPKDESRYYTKAQVLDVYELLRQFIDGTDRLRGCLIVAVPDSEFLDEDSGRGIGAYEALKFRVFDEIRDKKLVNPMASLVRLSVSANDNSATGAVPR